MANQRQDDAEAAVKQAEFLRLQITTLSLLLSGAIASILAFYTSRAISRPLEVVTAIARQVTEE